jgi:hypothetical protein
MPYQNKHDHDGSCSQHGSNAENLFERASRNVGFNSTFTSFSDQVRGIDYFATADWKIDVKARKRISRTSEQQDEYVWVEFKNTNGDDGWLYSKATHIAFEQRNKFVMVLRDDLAELCEELVEDDFVSSPDEAHLHRYQRSGRKDVLSLIPMHTILKELPCLILKKPSS